MKPYPVASFLLFVLAVSPASNAESENILTVGQSSYPIVFESADLTSAERECFAAELSAFFSYSTNLVDDFPEDWTEHGYRNYRSPQFINTETDFDRGLGYTNNPSEEIHVFQRFTNRYRLDGLEYTTYTNLRVSAFQFTASLNNGSVTNLPISEQGNLFLLLPAPPATWDNEEAARNLAALIHDETYFIPNFFDFHLSTPVPPFTNAVPWILLKSRKQGETAIFDIPIVHVNGTWKFMDIEN